MYSQTFDFQITKNEYIRISKIVKELSRLSSLSEIKELSDLWENLSCRNMFGYETHPSEKIKFSSYKELHKII